MKSWTLLEIKTKVKNDLDLNDEIFITPEELLGYINEGIDNAEAQIHTLYEDYFLTFDNPTLVIGTSLYDMPTDIYANKIRSVYYDDSAGNTYEIKRWRKPLHLLPLVDPQDPYEYIPMNTTATGYQMKLIPASREASAVFVTRWYIRNAKVLALDADVCDIPEFTNYVIQYAKTRCYEKEGNPLGLKAIDDTEKEKQLMIETLTNMVDDEDTKLIMDDSFYTDFDSSYFY